MERDYESRDDEERDNEVPQVGWRYYPEFAIHFFRSFFFPTRPSRVQGPLATAIYAPRYIELSQKSQEDERREMVVMFTSRRTYAGQRLSSIAALKGLRYKLE
ncbi:hypothetical protein AC579_8130 [Pseudocercospora musae]|uniref:Uncharacterized protein n=1 Tax=Pseudocercospora musae TaxID=113226 RepID=A0A139IG37_9PEZI|nr:hypothetical protein AC579_8130 [Pseudocercospora musae]